MENVKHNIEVIRNKIADAAKGKEVTLIGVSKTVSTDKIISAYETGLRQFGENKMQELVSKKEELAHLDIEWNFIGKLQKNKVKYAKQGVKMIQSVESLELCEVIQKTLENPIDVLLQVNIGKEPQKSGFNPDIVLESIEKMEKFDKIKVMGLMCIPPNVENPDKYFMQMYDMYKKIQDMELPYAKMKYLSMGMSGDFETAIKCGSNMVRVGSSIFGKRL